MVCRLGRFRCFLTQLLLGNQEFSLIGMGKCIIGFSSAHIAGTVYFAFRETSSLPPRPGESSDDIEVDMSLVISQDTFFQYPN